MRQATRDRVKAMFDAAEQKIAEETKATKPVVQSDTLVFIDADGDEVEIGERYDIDGTIVEFDGNYLIGEFGEHFTHYLTQPKKLKKALAIS